ncbi:TniQ family protein [Rhodovulum steppense]|uniref:TniQ protein n=1 Tax=Rhodovulum steppense TaxID=540251 RepID=A0A4V2R3F1_9RHOB|nr:TniQ family protein [Rhodovulum steppense]TCM76380.1 TniQ protein [Rhodovulum steppense]
MPNLIPRLDFDPCESALSFAARLAAFHTGGRATPVLRDLGIAPMSLVSGEPDAIARLCEVSGADLAMVRATTPARVAKRAYELRGHVLPAEFFVRPRTSCCPACLKADDARAADPAMARRHRWFWALDVVRTCPEHGLPLIRLPKTAHDDELHELGVRAPAPGVDLDAEIAGLSPREVSPLQAYVLGRLEGQAGPDWLDAQPLDQVVRAAELLGAVMVFDPARNLATMTEEEREEAGRAGYERMAQGVAGVRAALEALYEDFHAGGGNPGPQKVFGRLYTAMSGRRGSGRHGELAGVLRDFILDRFALPAGTKVLGQVLERRLNHTVASLAAEQDLDARTLRQVLVARGLVAAEAEPHQPFDADAGRAIAATVRRSVTVIKLPEALGCSRPLAGQLIEEGLIIPIAADAQASGRACKAVDAEDVRRFLESIGRAAPAVAENPAGLVPIGKASEKAKSPAVEIVHLILGGFLDRVVRLDGEHGLAALRVDPVEVKSVIGEVMIGLSPGEAFNRLRIPNRSG